jgi:hypothetical protein
MPARYSIAVARISRFPIRWVRSCAILKMRDADGTQILGMQIETLSCFGMHFSAVAHG